MDEKLTELYQLSKQVLESIHARMESDEVRDRSYALGSPSASRTGVESSESLHPAEKGRSRTKKE